MDRLVDRLFAKAKEGNQGAQEELFQCLRERFAAIARRRIWEPKSREDVVHEALQIVLEKYKTDASIRSFGGWAYGVLDFTIIHYAERKTKEGKLFVEPSETNRGPEPRCEQSDPLLKKRLMDCLVQVIKRYPRFAPILDLLLEEWKPNEISRELRIKPNNLYVILYRARRLLENCLEKGRI
ncbi:MAG: hypothetical protein KAV87_27145 [Desulfobacteraceae bacterium]|nr:hypothetical protein [Desulfobacteraceae bacterium]